MNMAMCPSRARIHFLTANLVTAANLGLGFLAVLAAAQGSPLAGWPILIAAALDGGDGYLARRWAVTSDFGEQFDSLADMTSFVLAPAVLLYLWAASMAGSAVWPAVAAVSFVVAGAFRLARFSVGNPAPNRFSGLPSATAAAVVAMTFLVFADARTWTPALALLLAALMASTLPYPKPTTATQQASLFGGFFVVGIMLGALWAVWAVLLAFLAFPLLEWLWPDHRAGRAHIVSR